jgi:CHAT domain-containing protein/glutaminase
MNQGIDEQRVQAYVGLIDQLLGCPKGQENSLLQENAALVDGDLVTVMGLVADLREAKGDSNAGWLRHFAGQLAQVLGLAEGSSASAAAGDVAGFVAEIVQLIVQARGNPAKVYDFFQINLELLNEELFAALPNVFTALIQQNDSAFIAEAFVEFGNLIEQFPLGSRMLNLEISIAAYGQALTVRTQAAMPIEWALTINNLAIAYYFRIKGNRTENIEQAIAIYEQALMVRTQAAMPIEWALTTMNLANAYKDRIKGDRAENIEQAIALYEQALTVTTQAAMPIEWALTTMNLALAYNDRIKGDRAENIEQAIDSYKQALTVRTQAAMPIEWALTTNNLAIAYYWRIRGDRAENIEQAIDAYKQALTVRTQTTMPIKWAQTTMNLAIAYADRIKSNRAENIEQAIDAYEQALTVRTQTAMPFEWAETTMNLANAYYSRIKGDRTENIEQAIDAYEQALAVRTQAAMPIAWAQTTINLANAYADRIKGNWTGNIEQAIDAYEQALTVMTQTAMPIAWAQATMNLANAYAERIKGDRAENIEQAIAGYCSSLTIFEPTRLPNDCRKTARSLANLYSDQQRWPEAGATYDQALEAAEILYQSATLLDSKATSLSETADLPRRAAYAFAQTGDLPKAVLTLEQGRARGLSESLDRDRANLTELQQNHPSLYSKYQDITQQLRTLEAQQRSNSLTPEILRNTGTKLRSDLEATIEQIRQVPSYEDFLTPTQWEDIEIALRSDNPLIYLVTTPNGSVTIVVTPENIEAIWSDFTETQLRELVQTWLDAQNSNTDRIAWLNIIDTTTRQLWDSLVGPIIQHLKTKGYNRAILIPTGYLSLLPLHAAWTEDPSKSTGRRYALDDLHITYAPNTKSLTAAQAIADRVRADSIFAIDNPRQDLANSEREIQAAISTFPQFTLLRHGQATVAEVRSKLPTAAIAHFSCHGKTFTTETKVKILNLETQKEEEKNFTPLDSCLQMSDGNLTLRDILALNLADSGGLRLAILSACETSMIGIENADEAISLPTGLLQAGVAAIIASLWSVSDLSTMMLLTRFYDLWRIDELEMGQAFRQAQQWVRDTTNGEKVAYFKDFMPTQSTTKVPASTADYLYKSLILSRSDDRDFAHPFHWAAFNYTGV